MDWSTENYVRLYVRDTAQFLQLTPHARWFFWDLLRRVDRRGHISLGGGGLKSLCPLVHAPWKTIHGPLDELLEDGCVVLSEDGNELVVRNFISAQTAKWESKHRSKRAREKARETVTECAGTSIFDPGFDPAIEFLIAPDGVPDQISSRRTGKPTKSARVDSARNPGCCGTFSGAESVPSRSTYGQTVIVSPTNTPRVVGDTPRVVGDTPRVVSGDKTNRQKDPEEILRSQDQESCGAQRTPEGEVRANDAPAEPSKPRRVERVEPLAADQGPQLTIPGVEPTRTDAQRRAEEAVEIWEHYMLRQRRAFPKSGRRPAKTPQRLTMLANQLKYYTKDDLITAIDAMWDSSWRVKGGYYQLEAAVEDAARIDRLLAEADNPSLRERTAHNVVAMRPAAAPVQPAPANHRGWNARVHFMNDKAYDANGNEIVDEAVLDRLLGIGGAR